MIKKRSLLVSLLIAFIFVPSLAYAQASGSNNTLPSGKTYYVATNGNDANSCTAAQNINTPKKTINAGIKCLASGDMIYVRGGTYNEAIRNGFPSADSWEGRTRIVAYPKETVWMTPQVGIGDGWVVRLDQSGQKYIEFDGINMDGRN